MNHKKEIHDVIYLVALQGLNYLAPLLVFPYLMKVLGADKFGYIGFSLSVTQYLLLLVDFGFNLSATKRIALAKDNPVELNAVFTATLYAKMALLLISFVLLTGVSFIPPFGIYRDTLFILFLMVVGHAFTFVWLFQGLGKIRVVSIVLGSVRLAILPLSFLLVKTPDDYLTAALLQALVVVAAMGLSIGIIAKKQYVAIGAFVWRNMVGELKESFPVFLSSAASSIYTASFAVLLGYFSTPEQVGQYSAAERIMRALCFLVFAPVSQAFYPKMVRMGVENRPAAARLLRTLLLVLLFSMLLVCMAMFFLSPYLVAFFGPSYGDAVGLFQLMAVAAVFIGTGGVMAQLGILAMGDARDKQHYRRVYVIAGVVALGSIFITIPQWGSIGATLSLVTVEGIVAVLMFAYGMKFLRRDAR
ncbi:MAG: flippase [Prevotellaceae bacterium]|jgi:O-antigen/teichoic acid export membrane protein|nr:flippase [Prevotellaceae bacterium]